MNPLIRFKLATPSLLTALVLFCFAFLPKAQAVSPSPRGCYPNYTTAEGCSALNLLTTGAGNTGLGWYSLFSNTDASFNTGVGGGALALNNGDSNTATGAAALLLNTSGMQNTAVGTDAMVYNDTGSDNTAVGAGALYNNQTDFLTAVGTDALHENTIGAHNAATGYFALYGNTSGSDNTANGYLALRSNEDGSSNTAVGVSALLGNRDGNGNTAVGANALNGNNHGTGNTAVGAGALTTANQDSNTAVGVAALGGNPGGFNIALGAGAGMNTDGSSNILIGHAGVSGESNTIRIGNSLVQMHTYLATVYGDMASGRQVYVDSSGLIGTLSSSRRYKKDIKAMDNASEALLALKPVTFHYRNDNTNTAQFGLVAEEVAEVNPDLITRDKEGKPQTVRYEAVNVMLLNEFLKEHEKVQYLDSRLAQQEKQIESLIGGLQKVSARLETSRSGTQVAIREP